MIQATMFPGRYIQGAGALERLGEETKRFGSCATVLCDPHILDNVYPTFSNSFESSVTSHVERFGGECTESEINRVKTAATQTKSDVIIGIGGGKTLDTAKASAFYNKVPVVTVPTIASTDAPCSALAVIYTPDGKFSRYLFFPRNPDMVLVDTAVVASAPVRFLISGMGDALATWFEAESCRQSFAPNMSGSYGSNAAFTLARLCYETLLEYGYAAKEACAAHVVVPALEHVVEANTLLSGLGFESGGLAAAHSIHNGLTVLEETHAFYHGEKVAIGTLASLFLTDKSSDIIEDVYDFCEIVGLPTTLKDIGIGSDIGDGLMLVAEAACAEGETIHNEPCPITPKDVVAAIKTADAFGRDRL